VMIFASEPSSQGPEKLLRFSPVLLCLTSPKQCLSLRLADSAPLQTEEGSAR
jgi:hypothetical protein